MVCLNSMKLFTNAYKINIRPWEKIQSILGMHVMFPECSRPVLPSDINREDLLAMMTSFSEEFIQRLIKSVNLQLNNSRQFEFKNTFRSKTNEITHRS